MDILKFPSEKELCETLGLFAVELGVEGFVSVCSITEGVHNSDKTLGVVWRTSENPSKDNYVMIGGGTPSKSEQYSGLSQEWYDHRALPDTFENRKEIHDTLLKDLEGLCILSWGLSFHRKRLLEVCSRLAGNSYIDVMFLFRALATKEKITTMQGVKGLNDIIGDIPKTGISEKLNNAYKSIFEKDIAHKPGVPLALANTQAVLRMAGFAAYSIPRL